MKTTTIAQPKKLYCPQFHRQTPWGVFRLTEQGWVAVARFPYRNRAEQHARGLQTLSGAEHKVAWEEVSFL